ncbi:MAG: catalase-related domain-containing protein, partial [Nitrosomonadales bacterium]|nr:catalase-related domain-containing protein [Nitrosomonadales bacterium]
WEEGGFASYPETMKGVKQRIRSHTFADHYSQATLFWRSQSKWEQDHIVSAFCFELGKVTVPAIRVRMLSNLTQVDEELVQRVAEGLGIKVPAPPAGSKDVPYTDKPKTDKALSMDQPAKASILGRKVAILASSGADGAAIEALMKAMQAAGANTKLLGTRLGEIKLHNGKALNVDHSLPTMPSLMFDAVFIPGGKSSVESLLQDANAVLFVKEAYKHGKAIAASDEGNMLISKAAQSAGLPDGKFQGPGVLSATGQTMGKDFLNGFVIAIAKHRFNDRADADAIAA